MVVRFDSLQSWNSMHRRLNAIPCHRASHNLTLPLSLPSFVGGLKLSLEEYRCFQSVIFRQSNFQQPLILFEDSSEVVQRAVFGCLIFKIQNYNFEHRDNWDSPQVLLEDSSEVVRSALSGTLWPSHWTVVAPRCFQFFNLFLHFLQI